MGILVLLNQTKHFDTGDLNILRKLKKIYFFFNSACKLMYSYSIDRGKLKYQLRYPRKFKSPGKNNRSCNWQLCMLCMYI